MNTIDRDAVIEECASLCERIWPSDNRSGHEWTDGFADGTCACADTLRALKSQPAQPDPRDEALRLIEEKLNDALVCNPHVERMFIKEAVAAIDALKGDN